MRVPPGRPQVKITASNCRYTSARLFAIAVARPRLSCHQSCAADIIAVLADKEYINAAQLSRGMQTWALALTALSVVR